MASRPPASSSDGARLRGDLDGRDADFHPVGARQSASSPGSDPSGDNQCPRGEHTRRSSLWVRPGTGRPHQQSATGRLGHTTNLPLDIRQINETPDSYGIIYFNGSPFRDVSINGEYSTPFAWSHETYIRPTLTDQWNDVGGGLNYQGKSYSDITNVNSIPPYLIANAAFGYDAKNWGIDVNVHNITNQRYFIAANAAGALVGEPLSAVVTVHASF